MTLTNSIPGCSTDRAGPEGEEASPLVKDKGCADTAESGSLRKGEGEGAPSRLGSAAEQRREEERGNGVHRAEDIAMAGSSAGEGRAIGRREAMQLGGRGCEWARPRVRVGEAEGAQGALSQQPRARQRWDKSDETCLDE